MKILLLPDKFKGSLSAKELANSIAKGVISSQPDAVIQSILVSDGGDGFLDSIIEQVKCNVIKVDTFDANGKDLVAEYLLDMTNHTAYIELAKASGLAQLTEEKRDVMQTSTFGTGILIKDAILKGCTSIYIGLGGSATNDAGIGIAEALGYYFLDENGNEIKPCGSGLSKIKTIHKKSNGISLEGVSIFAVNDVDNPLFGTNGAAYTYAAQKGAKPHQIKELDLGLQHFSTLVKSQTQKDEANTVGAGAAGGTAYGLKIFCDAQFISGADFVLNVAKVDAILAATNFDYVITGEGKLDKQTLHGKLIHAVMKLGQKHEVPILAVCGQLDLKTTILEKLNAFEVLEVQDHSQTLAYNMKNAAVLVEKSVANFFGTASNEKPC